MGITDDNRIEATVQLSPTKVKAYQSRLPIVDRVLRSTAAQ